MHEIDRSFRAKRVEAEERRARRLRQRILGAALGTAAIGFGSAGLLAYWTPTPEAPASRTELPAQKIAPAAEQKPVFVNPIIDLAGDPLIIRLGDAGEANGKLREVEVKPELKQAALPDSVEVMSDVMLSASERITALPSSPEDFAFFQSQSARGKPAVSIAPAAPTQAPSQQQQPTDNAAPSDPDADEVLVPVAGQDDLEGGANQPVPVEAPPAEDGIPMEKLAPAQPSTGEIGDPDADLAAGWGETVTQGQEALPSFKKTAIDDTTTVHLVKPEPDRFRQVEDFTVSVKGERSLDSVVAEYGFSAEDAKNAGEAAKRLIGVETLGDRFVVGLRGYRPSGKGTRPQLVQASINSTDKYLGTIARGDDGTFVPGADPWINDDLSQYAQNQETAAQPQSYRLLDAIYSTATRNSVPSSVTGEAIMLVSRAFDLQARATKDDRLVLAFAKTGRGQGGMSGRVLYVAIHGVDRDFECFVYQPQPGADFACMSEKDATHSVTVTNGMVTPVQGVLTSTFGPRMHPILHQVRIHKGVDWGAPVGTPVMAAFDGKIAFAGDGQGYGNVVKIDHGGGKATAYAHMSRLADGIKVGVEVKAGDVIGYVGTSGLSTGPHLHFELYQSGVAVDPLGSAVAEASITSADSAVAAGSNGSAVELMVNRIIHVESGGNARAQNPLSTAAGLGQFIKSTWLRMIRTYRPELFKSMSEAEILALRFDPTVSREMVANLARENEARLRAYGHSITAGRLYLAHFLGPDGAHQALAAPSNALVSDVLGGQVISANPFLTGKDCAYVVAWAEKKMTGKAVQYASQPGLTAKTLVQTSPEFVAYRQAMLQLVAMDTTQGATTPAAAMQGGAPADTPPADEGLQGGDE
ncbi:peptidoglycan DD-metalloendopeptidase family protein [Mesorhizobium sp. BAC0120]|uniref:peptidoglycan DD-metalloendopeptidase family protein n=1 Tax=Mesorhizobium sp. BAC0120 TaxID=3090670 RepID=UPI00298CC1A4|nr:peptidoglycan DD-metalloendopeptidase family protein [Mesorhizobium sp. BAC0120]MDW6026566.1 peptidoglycan DD-metalloendopeptidase family protein [Mesorhizobium sp. BAC0120]